MRIDPKKLPGARKAPMPEFLPPQLATLVSEPPAGAEWLHELKFDGYRMLYHLSRGKERFLSRNGKDWTEKFPGLLEALKKFPAASAILDGEIVIPDKEGRSSFQKLQQAMKSSSSPFIFEIFDLVYLEGFNITRTPLRERKSLLHELLTSDMVKDTMLQWRYSDHVEGNSTHCFKQACEHRTQRIVSDPA